MNQSLLDFKSYSGFGAKISVDFLEGETKITGTLDDGTKLELSYGIYSGKLTGKYGDRDVSFGPIWDGEPTAEDVRHPDWNVWCLFEGFLHFHDALETVRRGL